MTQSREGLPRVAVYLHLSKEHSLLFCWEVGSWELGALAGVGAVTTAFDSVDFTG